MKKFLTFLLILSSIGLMAQEKKSTLHYLDGEFIFPNIRVYLIRNVDFSSVPIIDLSEDMHHNLYDIEDTAILRSTGVYKLFNSGFTYTGSDTIEVTVKKQYKVIVRNEISPPLELVYSQTETLSPTRSIDGHITLQKTEGIKPKKKEVLKLLAKIIDQSEDTDSIHKMKPKELYKLQRSISKTKPNWNFELDRVFLEIGYIYADEENLEGPSLILELEQISPL
ncbi:MAG: hypothetical protein K9J13_16895 [Saprospiraceae bacterium]|nr:hypothetical protein [Saprospiraceae bacterium]